MLREKWAKKTTHHQLYCTYSDRPHLRCLREKCTRNPRRNQRLRVVAQAAPCSPMAGSDNTPATFTPLMSTAFNPTS